MSHSPLQPPVPFSDFEFTFDPSLSNLFPNPPPLPSSADLFSPAETTDLLGFLDNFNDFAWDFNPPSNDYDHHHHHHNNNNNYEHQPSSLAPYSNPHLNTIPEPSASNRPKSMNRSVSSRGPHHHHQQNHHSQQHEDSRSTGFKGRAESLARSTASDSASTTTTTTTNTTNTPTIANANPNVNVNANTTTTVFSASADPPARAAASAASRTKPLLSTPQKRLNHIMSEQKRRNAIRDGYAQLITLMAPAGTAPGIGMPTRGRPKGSGSRGKGQTKGKSGVLFRAVEYCRWLEEGRDTLQQEVLRVEAAAGIRQIS